MKRARRWIFFLLIPLAACSDDNGARPSPDASSPAIVQDLAVLDSSGNAVTLTWTAPGDDGTEGQASRYNLRYSMSLLTEAGWDTATVADSSMVPKAAGLVESLTVEDLPDGVWFFGLKSADEVPNWSAISNVVSTTLVDTVPPATVSDLEAIFSSVATVELQWSAPAEDGKGSATEYDLRYSLFPVTEETWENAPQVPDVPVPGPVGSTESCMVTGLETGTTYFFALKTTDEHGNWSALSNLASKSTAGLLRLTTSTGGWRHEGATDPAWSPDGESIVFEADWGDLFPHTDLYLIPATGGEPVRLTDEPDYASHATWSPDGSRIAFASPRYNLYKLWVMDAVPGSPATEIITIPHMPLGGCKWSPDGTQIAFTSISHNGPASITDLRVTPAGGGSSQVLISLSGWIPGLDWSPDGTRIAFGYPQDESYDIWILSVGSGAATPLTDDLARDTGPAWSPDGSRIAFGSNRGGNVELWLMSADGGNARQLTFSPVGATSPYGASSPSWSPDGTRIAFTLVTEIVDEWPCRDIWVLYWE
ncbi:MAG: PD40 domain-containing protein [Candidatus Eisenbacteria sp.]|nr:PD40 domain-containing protein [Candidatus Eisenbacteria bacterium]